MDFNTKQIIMAKKIYTRGKFEKFLNANKPEKDDPRWVMGGKNRYRKTTTNYGRVLRENDPIQYEVFFNDWRRAMMFKDKKD